MKLLVLTFGLVFAGENAEYDCIQLAFALEDPVAQRQHEKAVAKFEKKKIAQFNREQFRVRQGWDKMRAWERFSRRFESGADYTFERRDRDND